MRNLLGAALVAAALVACSGPDLQMPKPRRESVAASGVPADAGGDEVAPEAEVPPPDAAPPDAGLTETPLSSLAYVVVENGWGPVEKDTSNGEDAAGDGNTITLNGITHATGLGVHARSEITVDLAGAYKTFRSDVGVDDEVGDNGSIVFFVFADGDEVFASGVMTGASATQSIDLNVTGVKELKLVVTDAEDGPAFDHGDWASARVGR
jgi:hypothetical protein